MKYVKVKTQKLFLKKKDIHSQELPQSEQNMHWSLFTATLLQERLTGIFKEIKSESREMFKRCQRENVK